MGQANNDRETDVLASTEAGRIVASLRDRAAARIDASSEKKPGFFSRFRPSSTRRQDQLATDTP